MRSLLSVLLFASLLTAADWKPAPTPLMTRWGKAISADRQPWAEYPRPQLERPRWRNLNGLWDYAVTRRGAAAPTKWDGQILVPFCLESALGGVGRRLGGDEELWYRREVDASAWNGDRVLLHFDAVDWETTVFVNGKEVGKHRGGFDPFTVDVTDSLRDGKGELVVRVWDPTEKGSQPLGKQLSNPHGIWYTPVSGIWQTVWMEPVKATSIRRVLFTADIDRSEVECLVEVVGPTEGIAVTVERDGTSHPGEPNKPFRIKVNDPRLWTPSDPHLYPVRLRLVDRADSSIDVANSYFAMRKVSFGKDESGVLRLLLNNKPLFQIGPLDQGWWPDGLLTPPSDEAMLYDLQVLKKLGMNMLRKHIKVEPSRLYYHCDRLGLLVWQDMPSAINRTKKHFVAPGQKNDADDQFTADEKAQFRSELKAMIDHLRFFSSIYCWVPFNEGWGQHDTNNTLKWVKQYDRTRLVNGPSGWEDRGHGDMKDAHIYPGPGMFPTMVDRVSVLGEYGGLGLPIKNHLWKDQGNWGYRTFKTTEELRTNYRMLTMQLRPLVGKGLAAAVYTQTTDVEIEVNGLMTYDREVLKVDPVATAEWHASLFKPAPIENVVVETSEKVGQTWRYTTSRPADGWEKPSFAADKWLQGQGGLGTRDTPGTMVRTEWKTTDVWARRDFELRDLPGKDLFLRIHHDEDAEVYVNGVLAAKVSGFTTTYTTIPISPEAVRSIKAGTNSLAVHCKQTGGGQYIDVGIVEWVEHKK